MTNKNDKYPNEEDYKPKVDKHSVEKGELPLSDPAESNVTEVFRKNEAKEEGAQQQSVFGQNKEKK